MALLLVPSKQAHKTMEILTVHLGSKRNLTIKLVFPMGTSPDIVVSVKASDTREIMAIGSLVLKDTGNNIQPLTSSFSYKASTTTNLVSV